MNNQHIVIDPDADAIGEPDDLQSPQSPSAEKDKDSSDYEDDDGNFGKSGPGKAKRKKAVKAPVKRQSNPRKRTAREMSENGSAEAEEGGGGRRYSCKHDGCGKVFSTRWGCSGCFLGLDEYRKLMRLLWTSFLNPADIWPDTSGFTSKE
jgi:hypothetical protein